MCMWPPQAEGPESCKKKPELVATLNPSGFLILGSGVSFLLGFQFLVPASWKFWLHSLLTYSLCVWCFVTLSLFQPAWSLTCASRHADTWGFSLGWRQHSGSSLSGRWHTLGGLKRASLSLLYKEITALVGIIQHERYYNHLRNHYYNHPLFSRSPLPSNSPVHLLTYWTSAWHFVTSSCDVSSSFYFPRLQAPARPFLGPFRNTICS